MINEIDSVDKGNTRTDTLALERQRGITIKSAVLSFVIVGVTVNLIDTTGHPDFITDVERVLTVLIFVNKIDRRGADCKRAVEAVAVRFTLEIISMGSVSDLGTRSARFAAYGQDDVEFTADLYERLAHHDETLLTAYMDDIKV